MSNKSLSGGSNKENCTSSMRKILMRGSHQISDDDDDEEGEVSF